MGSADRICQSRWHRTAGAGHSRVVWGSCICAGGVPDASGKGLAKNGAVASPQRASTGHRRHPNVDVNRIIKIVGELRRGKRVRCFHVGDVLRGQTGGGERGIRVIGQVDGQSADGRLAGRRS